MYEICSKLKIKTPKRRHSSVSIADFVQVNVCLVNLYNIFTYISVKLLDHLKIFVLDSYLLINIFYSKFGI